MGFAILNLLIPEALIEKVIFGKRSERGGSKCKDPEVEVCLFLIYI